MAAPRSIGSLTISFGLVAIPVKLFNYVQYTIDPTIAAVSGATIVVAIVAITILDLTIGLDMLSDRE